MHPQSLLVHPFFDISVICAKYLAHILGSATEIIIKITLIDDFVSFDILNCKTIFTYRSIFNLSIKSCHLSIFTCRSNQNLAIETQYAKIRYIITWQEVFFTLLTGPVSVIKDIKVIEHKCKTRLA